MRRFSFLVAAIAAVAFVGALTASAGAAGFSQCPHIDEDLGCQFLITINEGGAVSVAEAPVGPYDGEDDTLVGIQNNSSKTITSIPLSATESIFGFDGDGMCEPPALPRAPGCVILAKNSAGEVQTNVGQKCEPEEEGIFETCGFEPPAGEPANFNPFGELGLTIVGFGKNGQAVSGYEGPTSYFSGISTTPTSGVVNFSPALGPAQSTYFSLEETLTGKTITVGNTTTLSTSLSGGGQNGASISVVQGTPVTDTATLGGSGATVASGAVSYAVYSDPACTKLAAAAGSGALNNGVAAPSSTISTLAPGTYYWQATYAGDINNQAVASTCGSEILTVTTPTTTTTLQTGGGVSGPELAVPVGTAVTDTAKISGANAKTASGTVTYTLYSDSKCSKAISTSVAAVVNGVAGPSTVVKPKAGTYYWVASYSGGGLNGPSASKCGSERLVVALKANLNLPSSKVCLSRRKFIAHPRAPKGVTLVHVEVLINGVLKSQGPLSHRHTTIDLIGLPKGTFHVSMVVTASNGKQYVDTRTFHTCVPKKHRRK